MRRQQKSALKGFCVRIVLVIELGRLIDYCNTIIKFLIIESNQ